MPFTQKIWNSNSFTYLYSLTSFPVLANEIDVLRLHSEIIDSLIPQRVNSVSKCITDIEINFKNNLTAAGESLLDEVISKHRPSKADNEFSKKLSLEINRNELSWWSPSLKEYNEKHNPTKKTKKTKKLTIASIILLVTTVSAIIWGLIA